MDASFKASQHRSGCCEIIELNGELDIASRHHLEAILDRLAGAQHLTIDLEHLTFIDSTGLHLLVQASRRVGGRLWIKGASRHVLRLLEITGVSDSFCLADDAEVAHQTIAEALAALTPHQLTRLTLASP